jgi:hypothetical protein
MIHPIQELPGQTLRHRAQGIWAVRSIARTRYQIGNAAKHRKPVIRLPRGLTARARSVSTTGTPRIARLSRKRCRLADRLRLRSCSFYSWPGRCVIDGRARPRAIRVILASCSSSRLPDGGRNSCVVYALSRLLVSRLSSLTNIDGAPKAVRCRRKAFQEMRIADFRTRPPMDRGPKCSLGQLAFENTGPSSSATSLL